MISVGTEGRLSPALPVWKTVVLGRYRNHAEYIVNLGLVGFRMSDSAIRILAKTPIAKAETTVDLVRATVHQMGFPNGGTNAEIHVWVEGQGFSKCPAEVGPALREQYPDQPRGERICVGMEPTEDSFGHPSVFSVVRNSRWFDFDKGLLLDTYRAGSKGLWHPEDTFVFALKQ